MVRVVFSRWVLFDRITEPPHCKNISPQLLSRAYIKHGLLHISAKASATASHKFRVELPHKIISQVFTIKKSIIVQQYNASGAYTNHICYLNVPWISMYEATNNNSQPWLPLSFDPSQSRTESDYHIRIKAEELPMAFDL